MKPRHKRKEFPFAALAPNKMISLLSVVYLEEYREVPSKVFEVLQEYEVKCYAGYLQSLDGSMELCLFTDVSDCSDPARLIKRIEDLPGVVDVEYTRPRRGFVADTLHFPLTSRRGLRMALFSVDFISGAFKRIHEVFGSGGSVILFESGYEYGKELAESFARTLLKMGVSRDELMEVAIKTMVEYGMSVGWFIPKILLSDFEKPKIVFRLYETFESEAYKGVQAPWGCDFLRGVVRGVLETLYGKSVEVQEVKCRARGDEYCEFHVEGK